MNALADKAKAIFLEAIEKTTPEERSAFVDAHCGADAELRQRVEILLRAHQTEDSFLDPGKLHPAPHTPSGHTQTSDFSDTSTLNKPTQHSVKLLPEIAVYFEPPQQPDSLGRFLHYEVLELLGQGGCGIVYRVFDTKLHRMVALKVMAPTLASHPASRQRFLREARAAAAVRHEHVISIHAVDETPLPHLIMEYISGQTLQQKIDKTGSLTTKEILRIGYQIALGLEAAHKQGLIHRDIKPANILLENGIERVKISDFGLARAIDDTSISHQGLIVGTPSYMSPEQAEGNPVDARSDLFSLGSTMYAMCAGQSPFQGSSTLSVLKRVVQDAPRPLREANSETPVWLEAVILKLLVKKPEDRYQQASAVAQDLGNYLAELQSKGTVQQAPPSKSRLRRVLAGLVLFGLILLILAFAEKRGLTNITTPILKYFYHQLTLHLPDRDTIVEVWQTTDTDENGKSTNLTSTWPFAPAATVVSDTTRLLPLPPGRYWLMARRHGKRIDRRLLTIDWGGSSTITLTLPSNSTNEAGTPSAAPRLLKAFDPKVDKPKHFGNLPLGPADAVTTEEGGWRLACTKEAATSFVFSSLVDHLPADGVVVCKAKVKYKKVDQYSHAGIVLHTGDGKHFSYEWPTQFVDYESDLSDWTDVILRYPVVAFQSKPAQLSFNVNLANDGIFHVKDLAFSFEPAKPPVVTSRTSELVKQVDSALQKLKTIDQQYDTVEKGNGSFEHAKAVRLATQQWLHHCIALAEDRQNQDETIYYLMKLKELQAGLVGARQSGSTLADDFGNLAELQANLAKTELRLRQVMPDYVKRYSVFLKRYDLAETPIPAPWADPKETVFVDGDSWRIENKNDAGMFYFSFAPILENIPTDGTIICKAKIKLKKKSVNGWGEMLLNAQAPDLAGYDWPKNHYQFESSLENWTAKEVRYPAQFFHQKNPAQIAVFFSFHMTGTIWIKDLELFHLPGPVPASTSRVPELVKLVELSDQQLKSVNEQYQAGLVPYDSWLKAKINWLNHCINLAEERKLLDEAIKYLVQLKDTQDKQLQFASQLIRAGRIKESDALPIQEDIVKTELKLKQAREQKK